MFNRRLNHWGSRRHFLITLLLGKNGVGWIKQNKGKDEAAAAWEKQVKCGGKNTRFLTLDTFQ